MLLKRLKLRISDMGTIKELCLGAEQHAHDNGEEKPGAEHFLLAALDLPDGTARKAFERLGADPAAFIAAIQKQHAEALSTIGIDSSSIENAGDSGGKIESSRMIYDAMPSGQAVMQELARRRRENKDIPLLGGHVIDVVASTDQGIAARALRAMSIDQESLKAAASEEMEAYLRKA